MNERTGSAPQFDEFNIARAAARGADADAYQRLTR